MLKTVRYLHVPRGLKQIPVAKSVKKTTDIPTYAEQARSPARKAPRGVRQLLPETVEPAALRSHNAGDSPVWYHVGRTHQGNLPVYTDYNNAGGVWTEVRKIFGSAGALRNDLRAKLGLPKKDIWIQDTSQRIMVKGNRSREIRRILAEKF